MRSRLVLLLLLTLATVGLAEPVSVTIWQKEHRYQPEPGETLRLQRGKFTFVIPLQADGEALSLLSAAGPQPDAPLFQAGQGMAGPYDGLFLTWEGFHYFYLDSREAEKYRRSELWDRERGLYYWKARSLYDNTGWGPEKLDWSEAPNLTFVLRKEGFEDLRFYVDWVD